MTQAREPAHPMSRAEFRRRFFRLILLTWLIPPVFGLLFIIYLGILTPGQVRALLGEPLEPVFIIGWLLFALWYFPRRVRPIEQAVGQPADAHPEATLRCLQRFPWHYWGLFLFYLMLAPGSVILGVELATGYRAPPIDWFRIHLVALIVSIIVGLPIFFRILDLFGQALSGFPLPRPLVTVKTKVFLIGALVPLLIDTILVQYYWTRTGFFTLETFFVWLSLELLAIGGSLIFVRSFGQSLKPLEAVIAAEGDSFERLAQLRSCSIDELGVLIEGYRRLLDALRVRNAILDVSNRLLRCAGESPAVPELLDAIVALAGEAIPGDMVFLILHDAEQDALIGVAQTGARYDERGHFRLALDEVSMAVDVFRHGRTLAIDDVATDPRVSPRLRETFRVRSALATPLQVEETRFGVLMTITRERRHAYTPQEVLLFENMAREAAIAIHTQRLEAHRLAAEAARQEREAMVRLLLESTAEAIYGMDTEGRCIFVNPACVRMLGYAQDTDLLGQDMHALVHHSRADGTPLPRDACPVWQATRRGESAHCESEVFWRADGRALPVEYWSHPIRRDGEIIGTVVTFIDISERLAARQALEEYRDRLEEQVAQRTAELTRVNEELAAFSYSVSHDLRSPLRAIDGFSFALLDEYGERLDDTGRDYLHRVRQAAQRMGELIDALLKLARISRADLHRQAVDLSAMAEAIMAELRQREPARTVDWACPPNLVVDADPALLRVVLENLLGNAWKYTRRTARPRIRLETEHRDGERVYCISDNGAGFDMAHAAKLFEPFQRLHSEAEFPGSGIGLATVERIIRRHEGWIGADARPGEGARFCFTLGSSTAAAG